MAAEWRRGGGGGGGGSGEQAATRVCVCCVASSFRGHGDGAAVLSGRRGEPPAATEANLVM